MCVFVEQRKGESGRGVYLAAVARGHRVVIQLLSRQDTPSLGSVISAAAPFTALHHPVREHPAPHKLPQPRARVLNDTTDAYTLPTAVHATRERTRTAYTP